MQRSPGLVEAGLFVESCGKALHSDGAAFDQTVGATFGNAVFDQAIRTAFSNVVLHQFVGTISGYAILDQAIGATLSHTAFNQTIRAAFSDHRLSRGGGESVNGCLLYTSDAADE